MGVFYHLRYPLLGLDIVAEKVKQLMVFQTLSLAGDELEPVPADIGLDMEALLRSNGFAVRRLPCTETYLCRPDPARPSCVAMWNRQEFLAATGQ